MDSRDVVRFGRPNLFRPNLVMGFEGWADAARISSGVVGQLRDRLRIKRLAEIRPDEFYIFQSPEGEARRPHTDVEEGLIRELKLPSTVFWFFKNRKGARSTGVKWSADTRSREQCDDKSRRQPPLATGEEPIAIRPGGSPENLEPAVDLSPGNRCIENVDRPDFVAVVLHLLVRLIGAIGGLERDNETEERLGLRHQRVRPQSTKGVTDEHTLAGYMTTSFYQAHLRVPYSPPKCRQTSLSRHHPKGAFGSSSGHDRAERQGTSRVDDPARTSPASAPDA